MCNGCLNVNRSLQAIDYKYYFFVIQCLQILFKTIEGKPMLNLKTSTPAPLPIPDVTITLTSSEFVFIQGFLNATSFANHELLTKDEQEKDKVHIDFVDRLSVKFESFQNQSGGACPLPAQPSEAVLEQGGSICYQCEKRVAYLFDDSRCKDCTRLTPEEVQGNVGQGGNQ